MVLDRPLQTADGTLPHAPAGMNTASGLQQQQQQLQQTAPATAMPAAAADAGGSESVSSPAATAAAAAAGGAPTHFNTTQAPVTSSGSMDLQQLRLRLWHALSEGQGPGVTAVRSRLTFSQLVQLLDELVEAAAWGMQQQHAMQWLPNSHATLAPPTPQHTQPHITTARTHSSSTATFTTTSSSSNSCRSRQHAQGNA